MDPMIDDLQLMDAEQVAGLLLVRKNMVYELVASGKLVGLRNGRKLAFTRAQVSAYIQGQIDAPAPEQDSAPVRRRRSPASH